MRHASWLTRTRWAATSVTTLLVAATAGPQRVAAQQFQVNDYTTGRQVGAWVATDADGNFVVVWESDDSQGTQTIQARRFSANGTPLAGQFQVNDYTTGSAYQPSVAMDADGRFVVAWASYGSPGNDTDGDSIQARRFASDGTPLGGQFQVNDYTTGYQDHASVTSDPSGNFVVAWSSGGSPGDDSSSYSIQGRRFDSNGTALAGQFQVNDYTTGVQVAPVVAADPGGNFVVAWQSDGSPGNDSSYQSIQARRFDTNGAALAGQFQVNDYTTGGQYFAAVASDTSGGFVVAWESYGSPANDSMANSIQARRFDPNGVALGSQFQVNDYTTSSQTNPSITTDNGSFVVAWDSNGSPGGDSSEYSIQARRFSAGGPPSGGQFQVNDYTTGTQRQPSVARAAGGGFVVAWASFVSPGNDSDSDSIQASIIPEPDSVLLGLAALAALVLLVRQRVALA